MKKDVNISETEAFKIINIIINDDIYSVSILDGDCLEVEIYNQLGFDCDQVNYKIVAEKNIWILNKEKQKWENLSTTDK